MNPWVLLARQTKKLQPSLHCPLPTGGLGWGGLLFTRFFYRFRFTKQIGIIFNFNVEYSVLVRQTKMGKRTLGSNHCVGAGICINAAL